jgi:predicted O-linked N-acetylglucosamine transferase (SPINDLY family)
MPPPHIFQRPAPRPSAPSDPLAMLEVRQAMLLHQAGKVAEAAVVYERVLARHPAQFEARHYLGVAQLQSGRAAQALATLERALALRADDASLQSNLGLALMALGRHADALPRFDRALALQPGMPEALNNRGWALRHLDRLDEALADLDRALAARPDFAEVAHRRALVLGALQRQDEAVRAFEQAIALRPRDADAHGNLGTLLTLMGRGAEARAALARAAELAPEAMVHRLKHAVAWLPLVRAAGDELEPARAAFVREIEALLAEARAGAVARPQEVVGAAQPFYIAYQARDNRAPLSAYGDLCAALMGQWLAAHDAGAEASGAPGPSGPSGAGAAAGGAPGRVRVGIVSSHVFSHSVWQANVRGWVEELDRARFELHVFHLGRTHDAETAIARARAEGFVSGERGLGEWVDAIRGARPDVLLYPELGIDALTPRLAALRLAPVQVASWGHPETTGLPTIDHYLSAELFEAPGSDAHYRESLVRLPGLGCCVAPAAVRPAQQAVEVALAELGLAPDATVFVCGGTPFKYAPEHDAVLVRIAQALPSAQFLFFNHGLAASLSAQLMARLGAAFAAAGLDAARHLVCAPWMERARFFGVLAQAHVFLDTLGFSGFNTVMQAVECGLPVVTRRGGFLRGRLGSGILERMGLVDLVADDDDAYVALALRLARDAGARAAVRARLAAARDRLYGDTAPIRALEAHLWRWAGRPAP